MTGLVLTLTLCVLCACLFVFKPTPAVAAPAAAKFEGLTKTNKMKVKWTQLGLVFFLVLSLVMTGCFFWQYQLPKRLPGERKRGLDRIALSYELCEDSTFSET